ncbi:MAG: HAD hydrolase-like protein [Anaerolineales bacterium]|nr:HAD hydrolase-like protein [Anaerolineales bacterium]
MLEALLLDLDNTLLGNDMKRFMPRYFALLAEHMAPVTQEAGFEFVPAMIAATRRVIANTRPELTNQALFWQALEEETGWDGAAHNGAAYLDAFYQGSYNQLQAVTEFRPTAAALVDWAFAQGLQVVIATNPLFPQRAIERRLKWAGVPVERYRYALVTHQGNMHATKPTLAYYEEILTRIGRTAEGVLMVGDDWKNDILPAHTLGMSTYWIAAEETAVPPDPALCDAFGSLVLLYHKLQDGWLL